MGKNTTVRQLERELQKQRDYESKNYAKVEQARRLREDDRLRKEKQRAEARKAEEARQESLREQRRKMLEEARAWTDKRRVAEEELEQRKSEEQEAKRKRNERRKGKKMRDDDSVGTSEDELQRKAMQRTKKRGPKSGKKASADELGSPPPAELSEMEGASERANKKRRLYKSAAVIESDLDGDMSDGSLDVMKDVD